MYVCMYVCERIRRRLDLVATQRRALLASRATRRKNERQDLLQRRRWLGRQPRSLVDASRGEQRAGAALRKALDQRGLRDRLPQEVIAAQALQCDYGLLAVSSPVAAALATSIPPFVVAAAVAAAVGAALAATSAIAALAATCLSTACGVRRVATQKEDLGGSARLLLRRGLLIVGAVDRAQKADQLGRLDLT